MKPFFIFRILLSVLFVAFLFTACSKSKPQKKVAPPVPIVVAKVVQKTVPRQLQGIGNAVPYSTVQVKPQVSGQLTAVNFKEGANVRKGDLLFTIDPRPFQAALDQAQANSQRDQAQAINANSELKRYTNLKKGGVASAEQFDQYKSAAAAATAVVAADSAGIENAQLQLAYCEVHAPIGGRTGVLTVNAGNIVQAQQTTLITINQIEPIFVDFSLPEKDLTPIRNYSANHQLAVIAAPASNPESISKGTLTLIDNSVDTTTGTIKLRATFANHDRALWPGEFVTITMNLAAQKNAIVVPSEAVDDGPDGDQVFILNADHTVTQKKVKVDRIIGDTTIIKSGLKSGETVITDGQVNLVTGSKVEIKKPVQSDESANHEPAQ